MSKNCVLEGDVIVFIDDLIALTKKRKVFWEMVDEEPKCYDYHNLSQLSECIRFMGNWENNCFTIIKKNEKFNFEVKFEKNLNIIKNLPFVEKESVQERLKLLFDEIDSKYDINYDFHQLFEKVNNRTIFY